MSCAMRGGAGGWVRLAVIGVFAALERAVAMSRRSPRKPIVDVAVGDKPEVVQGIMANHDTS